MNNLRLVSYLILKYLALSVLMVYLNNYAYFYDKSLNGILAYSMIVIFAPFFIPAVIATFAIASQLNNILKKYHKYFAISLLIAIDTIIYSIQLFNLNVYTPALLATSILISSLLLVFSDFFIKEPVK